MNKTTISLIGNPNCGKTTLFNALTGSHQHVGNWPGVTVEKKFGKYKYKNTFVGVLDLPGTYSIESSESAISEDELIARNYALENHGSLLINIIDATNLQRNLYLTTQLLDLNRPMIVVLNMMDALHKSGEHIDIALLQEQLGCPVVPISANRKQGFDVLLETIHSALAHKTAPQPKIHALSNEQIGIIEQCRQDLPAQSIIVGLNHWHFLEVLLTAKNDAALSDEEQFHIAKCRQLLASSYSGEIDIALASARYECIDNLSKQTLKRPLQASATVTERLDQWALGRFAGIPLFLFMMYLMFMLAINVGSAFNDFFDGFFGTIFVDGTTHLLQSVDSPDWLITVLANGIGTGIQTVSTFVPVIAAMFLCLSFLEDSGYLSRAAMVVDRGMRAINLPGKAFVPMLVGFGCNVPAIMGTRTLESPRDRLMSIMMIPYMSCGARLPVYALFAAVFFPTNGQNVVFALYLTGILVAIFTGLVLKHTLLPGSTTPFIMELPPYRIPTLRNLLSLTWEKLKSFILRAGKAIVLMVFILSILNSLGTDGSFGNQDSDKSVLAKIGMTITPAFSPMGIKENNWPATVGIFTGIFAKEAVIGTLNSLYSQIGVDAKESKEEAFDFFGGIKNAFATIPENLSAVLDNMTDPFGISSNLAGGDISAVQDENDIDDNTVKQISIAFASSSAAVAYLIFILLYTPCAAALGAVYREAGSKWTVMVAVWTFVIAWICATAYYQSSLLNSAPTQAISWLGGIMLFLLITFLILRKIGPGKDEIVLPTVVAERPESECCH